jgi:hypothetical protein
MAISGGGNSYDITMGYWDGAPYQGNPCEPLFNDGWFSRVDFIIGINDGGNLSITYAMQQTGSRNYLGEELYFYFPDGNQLAVGTETICWGNLYTTPTITKVIHLTPGTSDSTTLAVTLRGGVNAETEIQAQIHLEVCTCPIAPLTPLSAEDQLFEDSEHRWDETKLTSSMKTALDCLRTKVQNLGGTFDASQGSAYRTSGYQRHLGEVWDKYFALHGKHIPGCDALTASINAEWSKHNIAYHPAPPNGPHTRGVAFDATISGVQQDSLACQCLLWRPKKCPTLVLKDGKLVPKNMYVDLPHFELLGGRPCPSFGPCPPVP